MDQWGQDKAVPCKVGTLAERGEVLEDGLIKKNTKPHTSELRALLSLTV